jgi:hypothetical protein
MKHTRSQKASKANRSTTLDLLRQTREYTPVIFARPDKGYWGQPLIEPSRESSPASAAEDTDREYGSAQDFVFDTGNIRILVKLNDIVSEGKASLINLCQASPVWRKLLSPPQDSDPDEELRHSVKQVGCTNDDTTALLVLLNICYLNFQAVPQCLPYEQL